MQLVCASAAHGSVHGALSTSTTRTRTYGDRKRRRGVFSRMFRFVLALVCAYVMYGVVFGRSAAHHRLSARRADAPWEEWDSRTVAKDGRGMTQAMRLKCDLGEIPQKTGFRGVSRRFRPRRVKTAKTRLMFGFGRAVSGDVVAKTALLTGVNADSDDSLVMLNQFLTHYIDHGKIPAENIYVVIHSKDGDAPKEIQRALKTRGVTHDVYAGKTLRHSELSRYWQFQLANVMDEEDWVILADIDEHLFVPRGSGADKYSIPGFLADADNLGFELVNGVWIDRISQDGTLSKVDTKDSFHATFPRQCRVGELCDVRRSPPNTNNEGKPLPREGMVIAHKLKFAISDVRCLHDFADDDVVPAAALNIHQDNIFPVPVSVQHYQWHAGTVPQLRAVATSYEKCGLSAAHDAAKSLVDALEKQNLVVNEKSCPAMACSASVTNSPDARRIAIVTTVWEHVDGVSRTMKRFAEFIRGHDDASVLVMSPDLAERDYVRANSYDSVHQLVAPVPAIEAPGRPEYKMAAPLQARQRAVLEAYNPRVVHVAAPDMLGHSAVRWAAEVGACSVCSYHTAFDTYLQYYRVSLLTPPLRHLLSGFYQLCDVVAVPTYAAAEHLRLMGVPGEKMGFFPRGVNRTLYSPEMRDEQYRRDVFGVKDKELVILWVARIVREKGLASFVKTIQALDALVDSGKDPEIPSFRVVIAGDGPDLEGVRSDLQRLDNVVILGHTGGANLAKTYAAGDIFFFPSKTEVIPNNLIEAMASGLPVVTDDVGVNRAIVQDEVSGIIVKNTEPIPGDVTNYVNALVRLMKDRTLAERMSRAAVESTVGLTWERTFGSLLHAYDRCRPGLPYARHIPYDKLDKPELYPTNSDATEEFRDVIVDADAPDNSLLYRISKGITGGYVKSLEIARQDDKTTANAAAAARAL